MDSSVRISPIKTEISGAGTSQKHVWPVTVDSPFQINHQKRHEEEIKLISASRSNVRKNEYAVG
jgi:hypothetical protein